MTPYELDDAELEPSEVERLVSLYVLGMILANIITHPTGMAELEDHLC